MDWNHVFAYFVVMVFAVFAGIENQYPFWGVQWGQEVSQQLRVELVEIITTLNMNTDIVDLDLLLYPTPPKKTLQKMI